MIRASSAIPIGILIAASAMVGCVKTVQRPVPVTAVATHFDAHETIRVRRQGQTRVLHGPFTVQAIDGRLFLDATDGSVAAAPLAGTVIERDAVEPDHSSDWVWYVLGAGAGVLLGVLPVLAGQ